MRACRLRPPDQNQPCESPAERRYPFRHPEDEAGELTWVSHRRADLAERLLPVTCGDSVSHSVLSLSLSLWAHNEKATLPQLPTGPLFQYRGAGICRRGAAETLSTRSMRSTPCRFCALTGARGHAFVRAFGRVSPVRSSHRRWALSLTLTRFGNSGIQQLRRSRQ